VVEVPPIAEQIKLVDGTRPAVWRVGPFCSGVGIEERRACDGNSVGYVGIEQVNRQLGLVADAFRESSRTAWPVGVWKSGIMHPLHCSALTEKRSAPYPSPAPTKALVYIRNVNFAITFLLETHTVIG
jgi:hypothetical protein